MGIRELRCACQTAMQAYDVCQIGRLSCFFTLENTLEKHGEI